MREFVRFGLVALMAVALATSASAQAPRTSGAPAPKTPGFPAPKAKAADPAKAAPAKELSPDEVLATFDGQPVTRGDIVNYLGAYPPSPSLTEQQVYDIAVNGLINGKLLTQFLSKQKVEVSDKEIDATVAEIDKGLRGQNQSLANQMVQTGTSMAELRDKIKRRLQWKNYILQKATDAELKKFADENKDALTGAQVRASHILVMFDANASAADKEKAKQKLLAVKKEIDSGKITFAEAANKYSEDPINVQSKAGGDLNFFPRKGQFIEEFAAKAFGMKKGEVSDPIETRFGYHLIQVTEKLDGQPVDLAQKRDEILNVYASQQQEQIIADARKLAKIDVKPMPKDLFQAPPEVAEPAPAAAPAGALPKSTAGAPKNAPPR